MHKSFKTFALAGMAVAGVLAPAMAAAQDEAVTNAPPATETATAPGTAAVDKQAAMETWPIETQDYYKSLSPERQEMFWALSDTDKVRLSKLPEDQREPAWAQIETQYKATRG